MVEEKEAVVRVWVNRGLMVNAYALDWDDPDHPYNQIVSQGLRPEDYGISHPLTEEFVAKTRDDLIREILELRKEIIGRASSPFY